MSLLFKHFRVHQVFGANTDVGKTILTCALVRASALKANNVFYLKPVSTGPLDTADDKHVNDHSGPAAHRIQTKCLFRYDEPVSPHLAAMMSNSSAPSDETFTNSIAEYIRKTAIRSARERAHMYVETAGGVHSPTLSGTTQADCYRSLFLPTILIGDGKLGGISTTIASYEALLLRGYIVDAVLLFHDDYYRNSEYLQLYFAERGVRVSAVPRPPPLLSDSAANFLETEKYYNSIVPSSNDQNANAVGDIVDYLDRCHTERLEELVSMPRRTLDTVWWPFVQHGLVKGEHDVTVIDSAHLDFFNIHRVSPAGSGLPAPSDHGLSMLSPEFDGSASWWTQTVGHANPWLTLAAARASGRYGHVMFPQATHLPALKLAEKLVKDGPGRGWAARAFFSDNGSTGMEVALKMALRAFNVRRGTVGGKEVLGVLGLKGSYHGDTIGAMDACEESGVFTCEWHNAKGYWLEPPSVGVRDGEVVITVPAAMSSDLLTIKVKSLSWVYDVAARLDSDLAGVYRAYVTRTLQSLEDRQDVPKLAALVLEPLVMGAGGMIFVDPVFQRVLIDVVRGRRSESSKEWSGLPVIFDEVFVGLYRLGMESTGPLLGVQPDISVNAKILTGGLVPLAVTLASDSVFRAFLGEAKEGALLHGHSYTAHAVGCEVAVETLRLIEGLKGSEEWGAARKKWGQGEGVWSFWDPGFVEAVSRVKRVEEVMTLGCVLAIKIKDEERGYVSKSAQEVFVALKEKGIHYRTLGNVGYFISSLNTSRREIRRVEEEVLVAVQADRSSR